jgi:membrane fusion protein (multidrug efflux system)
VFVIAKAEKGAAMAPRAVKPATVHLGKRLGDLVAVDKGLSAGQEVVSSGVFRLMPTSKVIVNNSVQPGNEKFPNPSDT